MPEESAELRILHTKAYGRDGNPSEVELARLRELEQRRRGAVVAVPDIAAGGPDLSTNSGSGLGSGSGPASTLKPAAEPVEASGGSAEADTKPVVASEPRHPRRRWLVVGAAAILAIGVAIGWGVSGNTRESVPLTDEQRGWQDALAAEDYYDPGSFRAVSADDEVGVVVWAATKDSGARTCVIMGNGDRSSAKCLDSDAVRSEGIWLDLEAPTDDAGIFAVTTATLVFTPDGQPAAVTNSYFNSPSVNTTTVRPGSGLTVDTETGDVIEFTVDEPSFDDLAFDDKTGK